MQNMYFRAMICNENETISTWTLEFILIGFFVTSYSLFCLNFEISHSSELILSEVTSLNHSNVITWSIDVDD